MRDRRSRGDEARQAEGDALRSPGRRRRERQTKGSSTPRRGGWQPHIVRTYTSSLPKVMGTARVIDKVDRVAASGRVPSATHFALVARLRRIGALVAQGERDISKHALMLLAERQAGNPKCTAPRSNFTQVDAADSCVLAQSPGASYASQSVNLSPLLTPPTAGVFMGLQPFQSSYC